jgi:hypothetical protein
LLKTVRRTLLALLAVTAMAPSARAQDPNSQQPAANLPATINVYLDCYFCDFDYIRTEIAYVNWVRDPASADVHLLATSQAMGGSGTEYVLNFIGLRGFAQRADTLKYQASVNATSDDRRRGYTRAIKTGLVPFLARTALADRMNVTVSMPSAGSQAAAAPQRDPWHAWVMTLSGNSYTSGEKSYSFFNGYFYSQATRTTTKWKSILGGDYSYDDSKSTVENGNFAGDADTTYVTIRRNWTGYATQYRALNDHWSTGLTGSIGSNTYSNQDRYVRSKAGIEYNLFPYRESTRRQLRFQYGAGVAFYDYTDTTIYFKTTQTVPIHYLAVLGSARQPWGSLSGQITHNEVLNDRPKRSTRVNGSASVRIAKGLNFNMGGSYSWIHDQLYLRKGSASTANVLLRQQALRTSYSYYGSFGLSYTFGSIFNNVVFPRFGGNDVF